MGAFKSAVITTKGQALLAKVVAGTTKFNFSSIKTSETALTGDLASKTGIGTIKQTADVASVIRQNDSNVKVSASFSNATLTNGYYVRNIGLYAMDPQEGEILYSISVADESTATADWMPPFNGIGVSSLLVDLVTAVSNADNVTVEVDPTATATVAQIVDLQEQVDDVKSFVGYDTDDIYGVEVDFANKRFTRIAGNENLTNGEDFDTLTPWGGRRRCIVADNGTVIAYHGDTGYTEAGATTQAITVGETEYPIGTKVQVMVEQPIFYTKVVPVKTKAASSGRGKQITKARYYISPTPKVGFKVNDIFKDNNGIIQDKIYLAAYEGSIFSVGFDVKIAYSNTQVYTESVPDITAGVTIIYNTINTNITPNELRAAIGNGELIMPSGEYYSTIINKPDNIDTSNSGDLIAKTNAEGYITQLLEVFITGDSIPTEFNTVTACNTSTYMLNDEQTATFTVDKLCSISGAKPASGRSQNLTRANVRQMCYNRGTGWKSHDIFALSLTQWLILVEYASMDCQSKIGLGVSTFTDDGTTNMALVTGGTSELGNGSGIPTDGVNGKCSVSYRGEENLWGNIWTWLDGINHYSSDNSTDTAFVRCSSSLQDNISSGFSPLDTNLIKGNGYISAFGYNKDYDYLFLPAELSGSSNLPVGDYTWNNPSSHGWLIPLLGGIWTDGSACGAWCLFLCTASSHRARYVGGRLLYVPQSKLPVNNS